MQMSLATTIAVALRSQHIIFVRVEFCTDKHDCQIFSDLVFVIMAVDFESLPPVERV